MIQTRAIARTISVPADVAVFLDELAVKMERTFSYLVVKAVREYWMKQNGTALDFSKPQQEN